MAKFTGEISGSLAFRQGGVVQTQMVPGLNALALTGSLNITGSQLTLNGRNILSEIDALSAGSDPDIGTLRIHSASMLTYTGSNDARVQRIENYTSSINLLNAATSSYFLKSDASNVLSSSAQVEALGFNKDVISGSQQIVDLGFNKDVVSGSQQILDLGFVTSSNIASYNDLSNVPGGILSSSVQLEGLGFITGSDYSDLVNVPGNIVSSSAQIQSFLLNTDTDFGTAVVTASKFSGDGSGLTNISVGQVTSIKSDFNNTGSLTVDHNFNSQNINVTAYNGSGYQFIPSSVQILNNNSVKLTFDSLTTGYAVVALGGHIFSGSSAWENLTNVPGGIISSSVQIEALGFITSSFVSGDTGSVSSGTISSSLQISNLGFITGSIYSELIDIPSGIISSSLQISSLGFVTSSSGGVVSSGTISSSAQILDLGFVTSSGDNTPAGTISSSAQITAFGFLTSSHSDVNGLNLFTGSIQSEVDSLKTFTGSIQSQVNNLAAATSSYLTSLTGGILSSSAQVEALGFITASDGSVPSGTISSSLQISNLGFVTSSAGADVSGLNSKTGSYATTGSNIFIGQQTVSGSVIPGQSTNDLGSQTAPWQHLYITSGSVKFVNPDGTVQSSFNNQYDGNRVISNTEHPLFNTYNPGSTGTIEDFLNAMFFPNTNPTISTGNQTIAEFTPSGSLITAITGSDAESQAVTYTLDDSYTDGFVAINSNSLFLNVLPTTEAFNTDDRGDGTDAHPVIIKATDTVGGTATKTIYINVTTNTAPIFRETSVAGNEITSFTTSRNENATAGLISRIYFTDAESDAITITSQSDAGGHFSFTKYATYVDLRQVTSSLDYESITQYNMSITASDEHAIAGDDANAVTTLPVTINVTDNVQPTVNNQNLSGVNENSSDGATAGTISASDPEGDTITFVNSRLHSIQYDGFGVETGSYSGTSQASDPHEDAFSISSTGVVTRKAGVYLNSDIIDRYYYEVTVTDAYNNGSDTGLIGIPIADDTAPTISGDTTLYVIESAVTGDSIYDNTNGYSGTTSRFTANQTVTWGVSSSNDLSISSTGYLTLARDISGSATVGGDQINGIVTATNTFGTPTTQAFTINVTDNVAPTITFNNTSANLNTNKARPGNNLVTMTFSDAEGNSIDFNSFSASFAGSDLTIFESGNSRIVRASSDLAAGTYNVTASIADTHGFATRTSSHAFTIAQADTGTLSTNGTFYVIESATSGSNIVTNSNGRTGTQGDLSVSYSPSYGSPSVQAFSSSNAFIAVDSAGGLTLGTDISGSGNEGGSNISSNITFQDQYGNIGSGSITLNITNNSAPDISFSDTSGNQNTNLATSGSTLVTISFSDTEGDGIDFNSFVFTDPSGQLNTVRSGDTYLVQANNNLSGSTYGYTASIADSHGFATNTETDSFTVAQASIGTLTGDTSIYIIESAVSGAVYRDATGYNNGNAADVNVSYSPSYGSPVVQSFTSSNAAIVINSAGNLTLGVNISGSATGSGDTISSTITYQDQYGNLGSGSVTATVFANQAPLATFTNAHYSILTASIAQGTTLVTGSITDTESDTPFSMSLSGTSDLVAVPQNANSSSYYLNAAGTLSGGTIYYTASIQDSFGKTREYNRSLTISQPPVSWYAYLDEGGVYATSEANALSMYGDANDDGTTDTGTLFKAFAGGNIGNGKITTTAFTGLGINYAFQVASGTSFEGSRTTALLNDINHATGSQSNTGLVIVFPSGSGFTLPKTFTNSIGGSTVGEYLLYADRVGTGIVDSVQSAFVRYFDFESSNTYPNTSINRFGVIFTQGDATTDINYFLMASSGSAPSSTQ